MIQIESAYGFENCTKVSIPLNMQNWHWYTEIIVWQKFLMVWGSRRIRGQVRDGIETSSKRDIDVRKGINNDSQYALAFAAAEAVIHPLLFCMPPCARVICGFERWFLFSTIEEFVSKKVSLTLSWSTVNDLRNAKKWSVVRGLELRSTLQEWLSL